jgi:hypothetical protein
VLHAVLVGIDDAPDPLGEILMDPTVLSPAIKGLRRQDNPKSFLNG